MAAARNASADVGATQSSVAEAIRLGSKHYFTGEPCPRGHVAPRLTSNNGCVLCAKGAGERCRKNDPEKYRKRQYGWAERNPEKVTAAKRKSYEKNREKNLEYALQYRQANPDKVSAAGKAWYAKNAEKMREKSRIKMAQWVTDNLERHRANQRTVRARRKRAEGKHSAEDVRRIRAAQNDMCVYCRIKLKGRGHIDHRQPLSKGGTNWPDNIQITCAKCNYSKHNTDPIVFAQSIGRLI